MSPGKPKIFNWPPFKLYEIDADTGKPVDPNVGMKTHVTYYDIKKDSNGRNSIVAHKTPVPSVAGGKIGAAGDVGKNNDDAGEKKCGCAKKAEPEEKVESKKTEDGKTKVDGKDGVMPKNDHNKPEEKPWTTEEDAKLKALKAENKSWRDIAQEMCRSQSQLKARFKEIKDLPAIPDNNNNGISKSNQKSDKQKVKTENKHTSPKENKKKDKFANKGDSPKKYSAKREEEKKPTPPPKPASIQKPASILTAMPTRPKPVHRAGSTQSGHTSKFSIGEWLTLTEDDMFSFGELQLLSELIARDRDQTWLRIASVFFDRTGRKVHPHDIRDKFFQLDTSG